MAPLDDSPVRLDSESDCQNFVHAAEAASVTPCTSRVQRAHSEPLGTPCVSPLPSEIWSTHSAPSVLEGKQQQEFRRQHRAVPPSRRSMLWRFLGRDGVNPVESELLAKRRMRSSDLRSTPRIEGGSGLPRKLTIELWRLPQEEATWKTRWPQSAACWLGVQRMVVDMCKDVGVEACFEDGACSPKAVGELMTPFRRSLLKSLQLVDKMV